VTYRRREVLYDVIVDLEYLIEGVSREGKGGEERVIR
tara:strand:+ start:263 stop:373 length:111 start_codon:yes stop_codon:yes gene_type:complete